jgi:transcriptional regulator with XRE-family HTH domain
MATPATGGKNAPHAVRIRTVRAIEGYELQKAFAEFLGVSPSRLANIENGLPLSIDVAQKIVAKFPVYTLDWLYNGNEGGLSATTRQAIRDAAGAGKATKTPSRSRV